MEYEIADDPQGTERDYDGARDGGLVEDHIALRNQSSTTPEGYPLADRQDQSLIRAPGS